MSEFLSNDMFQKHVAAYQKKPTKKTETELGNCFLTLAEQIIHYCKMPFFDKNPDQLMDLVCACFNKTDHYSPEKGKAFNYFTTLVLNELRKDYRYYRKKADIRKKYQRFVKSAKTVP